MGMKDYERKLAQAEQYGSYDSYLELLQYIRKDKMRVPAVVVQYGQVLIQKHAWRLGDELWNVYEQVLIAALDLHDQGLASTCLKALKAQFPSSSRVARLEGMDLEQRGEYAKAEAMYEEELKKNGANALIMKRKVAVLKAQKKNQDAITALNEFLRYFPTDQAGWLELGEMYLSLGAYRYGAFCYEELVLQNPMDSFIHCRLADIYASLGSLDQLRLARKHYCHSIELNKNLNVRAYMGLVACTKAIQDHRQSNTKHDSEDMELNQRVQQKALTFLQSHYVNHASSDMADIATAAFNTFA